MNRQGLGPQEPLVATHGVSMSHSRVLNVCHGKVQRPLEAGFVETFEVYGALCSMRSISAKVGGEEDRRSGHEAAMNMANPSLPIIP